jgi:hypothetical protein|tara:strand:+ start:3030 stop:3440 length:411 start_codon:yes stop_codon:yes gene_type:complete
MKLDEVISISSRQGLFKILSKTRYGFIAQSLIDNKKISTKINDQISILNEIQVFGNNEKKPLEEIFKSIFKNENGLQTKITHKSSKNDLMNYFYLIFDNYDKERVYPNDVKKIIKWYNLLLDKNFFSSLSLKNIKK